MKRSRKVGGGKGHQKGLLPRKDMCTAADTCDKLATHSKNPWCLDDVSHTLITKGLGGSSILTPFSVAASSLQSYEYGG